MSVINQIVIAAMVCASFGMARGEYLAKDTGVFEKQLLIARQHPNYVHENVSEFKSIRYRIQPGAIRNFNSSITTLRVEVWVEEDTPSAFPVFIAITHKYERVALQLPYGYSHNNKLGRSLVRYTSASTTLCFSTQYQTWEEDSVLISVSTGSTQMIGFHMKVIVDETNLELGEEWLSPITPMTPLFRRFHFHDNISENVVVKIDSNNEDCMAVDISQPECPVFRPEMHFGHESSWELMRQRGSVRINMKDYLKGFIVKILLLQDDSLCGEIRLPETNLRRKKHIGVTVENELPMAITNGYFWMQMAIPLVLSLLVGVISGAIYLISYSCSRRMLACRTYNVNKSENKTACVQQFTTSRHKGGFGKWTLIVFAFYAIPAVDQVVYNKMISQGASRLYGQCSYNSLCSHKFWIFEDFNHLWSNISYLILGICFLLIANVKKCLRKRSEQDEGIEFVGGLYYAMGLALISKGILSASYHYCPSKSNFQYDTIYIAFLIAICQLKLSEFRRPNTFTIDFSCSLLAFIFLISTIGISFERYFSDHELTFFIFRICAAVMQGIFVFYSSVYAIYIGYPIDRFPKPDEKDEIPLQPIRMGVEFQDGRSRSQRNPGSPALTHFMRSIGDVPRCCCGMLPKIWHWKLPRFRCERLFYIVLFWTLNAGLIYYSLMVNYCLYVFIFLGTHFLLNLSFYLFMKLVFGEFTCSWKSLQVVLYFLLALSVGALSGYLFQQNLMEWTTPATPYRTGDEECLWLKPYPFYDKHDSWHIVSAHAFFFIFMVLLSIDDGIESVNQEYLSVF